MAISEVPGTNEKPFFGGFTQNYRIGAMCVVLGGVLLDEQILKNPFRSDIFCRGVVVTFEHE